jgi:hypothetical protein
MQNLYQTGPSDEYVFDFVILHLLSYSAETIWFVNITINLKRIHSILRTLSLSYFWIVLDNFCK